MDRIGIRLEIHKHEAFPGFHADGNKAVIGTGEVLDSLEFRHALERSIQTVLPPTVRTLQDGGLAARLCNHGSRVVAAYVVESAQFLIGAAHDNDWLARQPGGYKISGAAQLLGPRHQLPRLAENVEPLKFRNARIGVPGRRNG